MVTEVCAETSIQELKLVELLAIEHTSTTTDSNVKSVPLQATSIEARLQNALAHCQSQGFPHERVANWILDNSFQLERAIRQIKKDLPENYYQELPVYFTDDAFPLPRILDIAHELLNITQLQLTQPAIAQFVNAYQHHSDLFHGELWALPAMLRLACLTVLLDKFEQLEPGLNPPEVSPQFKPSPIDDPTECVARSITSLIVLSSIDWKAFVDDLSVVEAVLLSDPSGAYEKMDFETRERFRKVVESLSRISTYSEREVAQTAIRLATDAKGLARRKHVGYWLIDKGVSTLESELGAISRKFQIMRFLQNHARGFYSGLLTLATFCALWLPLWYLAKYGASLWQIVGFCFLLIIPASVLGITVVHWLVPIFIKPGRLPALNFNKGIPQEHRCVVAIPVILKDSADARAALHKLELQWLSNSDSALSFVLISDLADAAEEFAATDKQIESELVQGITSLNKKHGRNTDCFYLLHRHREFNKNEQCWMGWERKRGKLEKLNHFILNADSSAFQISAGAIDNLPGTKYVITLDADTLLPPGAAAELIGTLAHPLNEAVINTVTGRVDYGYTILQPRVELIQDAGDHSLFAKLYAGDSAIDIYSRAVSDVYQDLFSSGLYVGKGIYAVAAFQQCIENRMPDNRILSHDLIEGIHGRVGLVSNIVVYEQFPDTYPEYAMRQHRWIRGDWQLLPWLFNKVPTADGNTDTNPLNLLDRWKLIDNLRRSLIPPVLLIILVSGWFVLPGTGWAWTIMALAVLGSYLLNDAWKGIRQSMSWQLSTGVIHSLRQQAGRWFLSIVFLVNDAMSVLDAIARTLWRTLVSHRRLLEWRSAAHSSHAISTQSLHSLHWNTMWPATAFAIITGLALFNFEPRALWAAMPVLLLWLLAPEIAYRLGRRRTFRRESLSNNDRLFALEVARRTWHYFDTFARPQDHWLPPDNFQESPKGEIAHRTSPTNIGLYLVSALTARDFGFIGTSELCVRCTNALDTMEQLEMYQGHLLNWYNTTTLEPLEPKYVSTVDNGNLALSLIAIKQGCLDYALNPIIDTSVSDGLNTSFRLLKNCIELHNPSTESVIPTAIDAIQNRIDQLQVCEQSWFTQLTALTNTDWPTLQQLIGNLLESESLSPSNLQELHVWYERFNHQLLVLQRDIDRYFPWLKWMDESKSTSSIQFDAQYTNLVFEPLNKLVTECESSLAQLNEATGIKQSNDQLYLLKTEMANGLHEIKQLKNELNQCASRADKMAYAMNFDFLYDSEAHLLRIGYNVSSARFDHNNYDLLASEARLASFFAIAKKDIPIDHWSHLGRPLSLVDRQPILLSWSGSMFEYLMPTLFLPGKRDTLLGESERLAVVGQRHYAEELDVPWGISESAFAAFDADDNYQYRAFGTPGLGLRRGLEQDLVIAPYASALALCVFPQSAIENMRHFRKLNAQGLYGFIDALDFTVNRRTSDGGHRPVHTYMAHHQGMTMAAVANALLSDVLVERVLSEKPLQTVELLLQERIPWDAPIDAGSNSESMEIQEPARVALNLPSWIPRLGSDVPQMQLLGNQKMSSWVSASGGGGLFLGKYALTRWSNYPTGDVFGQCLYIQFDHTPAIESLARALVNDTESSEIESTSFDKPHTEFSQHTVEHQRRFANVMVRQNITVAPSDNAEIRIVHLSNEGIENRKIVLTSYAEVSLAPLLEDERHPAFSKLSVHSQYLSKFKGLMFTRRSRDKDKHPPALMHKVVFNDPDIKLTGFESDRKAFLGRQKSLYRPMALTHGLRGTVGWTQDAVMALQVEVTLPPGEQKQFALMTLAADSQHELLDMAQRFPSPEMDWLIENAKLEASHEISQLEIDPAKLPELQMLVSALLHPVSSLRVHHGSPTASAGSQTELWQFGLSGDIPILLLTMADEETSGVLEHLVRAQHLWRGKGFEFDLVILRKDSAGYEEPLREQILSVLRDFNVFAHLGRRGGIHLLSADHIEPGIRQSLESLATVWLNDNSHSLHEQLGKLWQLPSLPPLFNPMPGYEFPAIEPLKRPTNLSFDNGIGGFDPSSGDYIIHLEPDAPTPAPWCNVIANENFGTVVSESGLGFTWLTNSGEYRLTPWANDPVIDTPSEVLYMRDETNADIWSVTASPLGQNHAVRVTHGLGYTRWEQHSYGLQQSLTAAVAVNDPVKLMHLQLHNPSSHTRRITATYYVDWCLGAVVSQARPHVCSSYDADQHAIFAHNAWSQDFIECVAFVTATAPPHSISGDRSEFLGPLRDVKQPQGLERWDLGGHFSPTADACAAYQLHINIAPNATEEVVFILGAAQTRKHAHEIMARWRTPAKCKLGVDAVHEHWQSHTNTLQVKTPDPAFDLMINRWLPYQALSCRIHARAGYYQAGGAFGFRDQLQDVLSLVGREPDRVRAQIIEAARHQFEQGDALHWWHPPAGRGVRTRCSDDYLWLVYVVSRYIKATGDTSILDVEVPFLHAPALREHEHDRYSLFETGEVASIYTHCCRALQYMQQLGSHGLPLIGDGDWNDGMNRIGDQGRGESVWLAWFQITTVDLFTEIALNYGDEGLVHQWRSYVDNLKKSVEDNAWDGEWYVRAFDDEGVAWGSSVNDECRIDSLSQSWAVLSGAAEPERAVTAMASATTHLLDAEHRLVRLLAPPFDQTARDPGYIKAYPPGVRENGGQYTHAATWFGLAAAALGDGDKAFQVFDIISPIRRTLNLADAQHYAREPYVLAGDVSGSINDPGRGGWSWYTGAASWAWQLGVHAILGIDYVPGGITVNPCLPSAWKHVEATINRDSGSICLRIEKTDDLADDTSELIVDGQVTQDNVIVFPTTHSQRHVVLRISN